MLFNKWFNNLTREYVRYKFKLFELKYIKICLKKYWNAVFYCYRALFYLSNGKLLYQKKYRKRILFSNLNIFFAVQLLQLLQLLPQWLLASRPFPSLQSWLINPTFQSSPARSGMRVSWHFFVVFWKMEFVVSCDLILL